MGAGTVWSLTPAGGYGKPWLKGPVLNMFTAGQSPEMFPRRPLVHERAEGARVKKGIRARIQRSADVKAWRLSITAAEEARAWF